MKNSAYLQARKKRRAKILKKREKRIAKSRARIVKLGRNPLPPMPGLPPGPPIHQGPCSVTRVQIDDGMSTVGRLFAGKKKRYRVVAGKGHRLASFDHYGRRVWHPRYADVKKCIVPGCDFVMKRTHAPKPDA